MDRKLSVNASKANSKKTRGFFFFFSQVVEKNVVIRLSMLKLDVVADAWHGLQQLPPPELDFILDTS